MYLLYLIIVVFPIWAYLMQIVNYRQMIWRGRRQVE
nr:MAG TPA: hypothetical protein [Caudoviricetes sp.]